MQGGYTDAPHGAPGHGPAPYALAQTYPGSPGYRVGPAHGWPGFPPGPRNAFGTASLVCGIIGAALFVLWPLAVVLGVLAIVFGILGKARVRRREVNNGGQSTAGIICGAFALVLGVVLFLFVMTRVESVDGGSGDGPSGYSAAAVPLT
ncbi:DUF4190 domain-containing protein [Streptomyces tsukubensis]|uniref:DUF4190 domain-containing protein n=1 Tax=Streptomyces tsukubensis TaxID=83656 RepID=UPI001D03C221